MKDSKKVFHQRSLRLVMDSIHLCLLIFIRAVFDIQRLCKWSFIAHKPDETIDRRQLITRRNIVSMVYIMQKLLTRRVIRLQIVVIDL